MTAPAIAGAMLNVQRRIREIPKTGQNRAQGYAFRTIDDVLTAVRTVATEEGIIIRPERQEVKQWKAEAEGGKTKVRCLIEVTYTFMSTEDGSLVYVQAIGEGVDFGGDKASYKAMTGAQKYALTQAFSIPCDGLDPEIEIKEPKAKGR